MQSKWSYWLAGLLGSAIVAAAIYLAIIFGAAGWMAARPWAAAWVQAVGSVIAIFVAILIPALQHRKDRKQRTASIKRLRLERLSAVIAIVQLQQALFQGAIAVISADNPPGSRVAGRHASKLRGSYDQISSMAITELGAERVRDVLHIRRNASYGLEIAEMLSDFNKSFPDHVATEEALNRVKIQLSQQEDILQMQYDDIYYDREQHPVYD